MTDDVAPPFKSAPPVAVPVSTGEEELSAHFEAAHAQVPLVPPAGGDFHAAFTLPDGSGKVAVVLGDVVGHGPEAAIHAEHLKEAISGCLAEGMPPSEALGFVNAAAEMDPKFTGFATVFAATVEPETGQIVYASGGHEPALLSVPEGGEREGSIIEELPSTGPPIGVLSAEDVHYAPAEATLASGETLLLYTDGVTDVRRGHTFLGLDRLRRWMSRFVSLSPVQLVRKLVGKVHAFAENRTLRDDLALLILRRRR